MVDVKVNFKKQYLDTKCNFCDQEETQSHLMECSKILQNCQELYNDVEVDYEDMNKSCSLQLKMVKLFKKALSTREKLLSDV